MTRKLNGVGIFHLNCKIPSKAGELLASIDRALVAHLQNEMNLDVKRFGIRHKGMRNRTASCAWTLLELDCLLLCDTPDANASLLWIMSGALAGLSCYADSDSDTDSSLDADKPTSKVQHAKHPSSDPANASGVKPEPAPDTPSIRKKR